MMWKPICDAPRDGTQIDLFIRYRHGDTKEWECFRVCYAWWEAELQKWMVLNDDAVPESAWGYEDEITHFMIFEPPEGWNK